MASRIKQRGFFVLSGKERRGFAFDRALPAALSADDALQNGDVPAEYRDYVRDYFSSLNPKQNKKPEFG